MIHFKQFFHTINCDYPDVANVRPFQCQQGRSSGYTIRLSLRLQGKYTIIEWSEEGAG
jgi:hypothetical protein